MRVPMGMGVLMLSEHGDGSPHGMGVLMLSDHMNESPHGDGSPHAQ